MKFQCFEVKPEDDINESPHDDKPSTGMFAGSGEQILLPVFCICFAVSIILFLYQDFLDRLPIDVSCVPCAVVLFVVANVLF